MKARETALATLRRCAEALARSPSVPERERLQGLHEAALLVLEQATTAHRPATVSLIARVQRLERDFAHMNPAERACAIRERLGIGRAYYYKLRRLSLQTTVDR